jgi:hypothetical protein
MYEYSFQILGGQLCHPQFHVAFFYCFNQMLKPITAQCCDYYACCCRLMNLQAASSFIRRHLFFGGVIARKTQLRFTE